MNIVLVLFVFILNFVNGQNCPPTPGNVTSFNITSLESFNATISWEISDPECVSEYIIYLNNQTAGKTAENEFILTDLYACENYTAGITVLYNDVEGEITEIPFTTPVPNPFDYQIENLELTRVTDTYTDSLNITWQPPADDRILSCITSYYLVWWDQNSKTSSFDLTETYYVIDSVIGCITYNIQIVPKAGDSFQGLPQYDSISIEDKPTNAPRRMISYFVNETSVSISWVTDSYAENMCMMLDLVVTCEAPEESNSAHSWIEWYSQTTVAINSNETDRPTRFTTNLEELSPFTNYSCYAVVINSAGNSSLSDEFIFRTNEEVPSAPEPVIINEVTSNGFEIRWSEPEKVPGILSGYNLYIENNGPNHFVQDYCLQIDNFNYTESPDTYQYMFSRALPNFNYTISTYAVDGAGSGEIAIAAVTTKTSAPEKPSNVKLEPPYIEISEEYIVTQKVDWEIPCNTNGPLLYFKLDISGQYVENGEILHLTDTTDLRTERVDANKDITDISYSFNITSIKPSYYYEINISAVLEDDTEGDRSPINFISPDGLPGAPDIKQFSNETVDGFTVHWEEPSIKNGKILHYQVTIQPEGPLYEVPPDPSCIIIKNVTEEVVNETVRNYVFQNGLPYYGYTVFLKAETSAGFGPASEGKSVSTLSAEPEPVRNGQIIDSYMETEQYIGLATITFDIPCRINGPLQTYQIHYTGKRENYEDHTNTINTTLTTYEVGLKPDFEYLVEISVVTEKFRTTTALNNFHSRPGVPLLLEPNIEAPKTNTTNKAYFQLQKDVFDETNGEILYYALIIMPKIVNSTLKDYGFWDGTNDTWPQIPEGGGTKFDPYQITKKFWNPFENEQDIIDIVIGDEVNCSANEFCNKPLKENTEYSLIVRALTSATYKDTQPINFKTLMFDEGENLLWIIGLVFGLLFIVFLIIFIIILWRRRNRSIITEEEIRNSVNSPPPINCKKFASHYEYLLENYNILKAQFTTLGTKSKEVSLPTTFALLPENKRKNRYTNILPYDDTRVKLKIDEDDEISSDYINASYVKGYSSKTEYISTQGPLEATCKDFWKMIIQEQVSLIVMVSQFIEQGKEKCFQYFPSNHENITFGDYEVRCSTELHFGTYCIRTLQVRKDTTQRTVIHLQFLEWPDFGVPSGTENILQFCFQIRERAKADEGLIVVHCSAGVGRTGTIIALDILLQTIEDHRDINIFKTILDLRKQRTNMVQTEKQYMFIHTCIRDALENPVTPTRVKETEHLYENMNILKSSLEDNLIPTESESAL